MLFPAFNSNYFNLVDQEWFDAFQIHSEGLVVSRIILAEEDALWHSAGLNGLYVTMDVDTIHMLYQMDIYLSGETPPVEKYNAYHSQNGFQGTLIAIISRIYQGSRLEYYKAARAGTAFLSALCVASFLVWVLSSLGWLSALATMLVVLVSGWLVVTGTNIFFQMWSFFLPVSILLWSSKMKVGRVSLKDEMLLFILCWALMFVKCLFSGFEFITTTCVIVVSICVFNSIRYNWSLKEFVRRSVVVGLGTLAGIATSFLLLLYQITLQKESFSKAKYTLKHTLFKRTYGSPDDFEGAVKIGLEGSLSDTLEHFFSYPLFAPVFHGQRIDSMDVNGLNMWHILIIASLLTFSWIILRRRLVVSADHKLTSALIAWFWFSIIGPLTWYIIFKSHAYAHPHLDMFVWFMLTMLLFPLIVVQLSKTLILHGDHLLNNNP